jgi:hypothetical protein
MVLPHFSYYSDEQLRIVKCDLKEVREKEDAAAADSSHQSGVTAREGKLRTRNQLITPHPIL